MTVVDQGSFSAAAKTLYVSQPAISKSIQEFERQLGVPLIDRSQRKISLTEPGMILYEYAQQLFAVERAAIHSLAELNGLEQGHLAIGASHTTGTYLLPPILHRFHESYPHVALSLRIKNTRDIIEELRTVPLDVAFVEGPIENGDLRVTPWIVDHLVVIAPAHHVLCHRERITIEDILQFPYIQREPGSGTREIVEQAFAVRGLSPTIAIELGGNQVVKQAVIAGLGLSIVSQATVELERKAGAVCVLEAENFQLQRTLSQVTIKDRPVSRALAAFLDLVRDEHPASPL